MLCKWFNSKYVLVYKEQYLVVCNDITTVDCQKFEMLTHCKHEKEQNAENQNTPQLMTLYLLYL